MSGATSAEIEAAKQQVNSEWGYMQVIQSAVNAAVAEAVRDVIPCGWERASPDLIGPVAEDALRERIKAAVEQGRTTNPAGMTGTAHEGSAPFGLVAGFDVDRAVDAVLAVVREGVP